MGFLGATVVFFIDFAEIISLSAERTLAAGKKPTVVLSLRTYGLPVFHVQSNGQEKSSKEHGIHAEAEKPW